MTTSPPPVRTQGTRPTHVRYRVLGWLFLLSMVTYLDRMAIGGAGPWIRRDLGLTPFQLGWVFGAFQLAYGLFEIPSGWLGDRFGPRRMLTRIVLWWSAFTALTGRVSSYWSLVTTRFLFGAGEAGAYPNAACAISRWFPFAERARAQGVVWMAGRIGGAFAPLLVAPLLDPGRAWTIAGGSSYIGWRNVFFLFGGLGVFWAAGWYWWYRDDPRQMPSVNQAELDVIHEGGVVSAHHSATPWGVLARSLNLWAIVFAYFVYGYGVQFYFFWLPTYVKDVRGLADWAPYAALPFILGAVANGLGGWTSDALTRRIGLRWGRRTVAFLGLGGSVVFVLLSFASTNPRFAVFALAFGFASTDFALPNFWAVCLDIGKRYSGTVTGTMNTAAQIGGVIASLVIGFFAGRGQWNVAIASMAVMLLVSALLFFVIDASHPLVEGD